MCDSPGPRAGHGELGAARVTAAAALGGGVRRRAVCGQRQCRKKAAKGSRSICEARVNYCGARAWLQWPTGYGN